MALAHRPGLTACAAAIWLAGCAPAPGSGQETAAPGISDETLYALEGDDPANEELVSFAVPPEDLITAESIGVARPGSSLGDLRDVIGSSRIRFVERYSTGLSAVCVDDAAGDELFCAAIPETAEPNPFSAIVMISTRHPRFRTREGVGPGIAVEDVEVVYGGAYFVYNEAGERREYVEFDRGPAGSIRFLPLLPSDPMGLAGVYEESPDGFHETEDYRPGAVIGAVEVHAAARE
jgi:hypothetical protein